MKWRLTKRFKMSIGIFCMVVLILAPFFFVEKNSPQMILHDLETDLVDLDQASQLDAKGLNELAKAICNRYDHILTYEVVGKSFDGNDIGVIVMSGRNEAQAHYLMESGTHAREVFNPLFMLKTVEDYAKDFEDDTVIPDASVSDLLKKKVALHFYYLTNPDGYNIAKFGFRAINDQTEIKAHKLTRYDPHYFKANARGVDLNRNFDGSIYDKYKSKWIQIWAVNKIDGIMVAEPHGMYFEGDSPGSEPETKALQDYVRKYPFKLAISYHSMGRIIYYDRYFMDATFNGYGKKVAKFVSEITGYKVMPETREHTSGFFGDYFASVTGCPTITLETTLNRSGIMDPQYFLEYKKLRDVPLLTLFFNEKEEAEKPYQVFDRNNKLIGRFQYEYYAKAIASRFEGTVKKEQK